jgi:hypothetical protein
LNNCLTQIHIFFQGLGKMKGCEIKIHIDPTVQPVAQPHRRVPFHIRDKVEKQITQMIDNDIIEPVTEATPWISPIVVVRKQNSEDVRICIDMRRANVAVQRERHIMPSMDEIIQDLDGSTIFSKLDLNQGYHQLPLHPDSRYITTFSTHVGLYRYKRLNFGISSASEIFQNVIAQAIAGIPGAKNISDDILIHARNPSEHLNILQRILQRLSDKGLTLNKSKCEFCKDSLIFYGHKFSAAGMSPDPKKVAAVKAFAPPTNVAETRSIIGMITYFSRFLPDLATIAEPLRALTAKCAKWEWNDSHQRALDEIKNRLTSDTIMTYFDPNMPTELIVDASPVGLGAILTQRTSLSAPPRVLSYASKALSPVECRYSQTEREALAVVWGCEHFHLYLYGKHFTTVMDHKPLERLYNNPSAKPPIRIERWALRLQNYDTTVVYRRGADNPADYLSRHPINNPHDRIQEAVAEAHVAFVTANHCPDAITIDTIKAHTAADPTLRAVITAVNTNRWHDSLSQDVNTAEFKLYAAQKEMLSVSTDGSILLRSAQIAIPQALHDWVVNLAHEGHQGLVKTKQLLRDRVYFPGIDKCVQTRIDMCIPCQANTPTNNAVPLEMTPLPQSPWQRVSMDFCGPFNSGDYIMVLIDDYSRFPVVEIIRSTAAQTVIPRLDKIFAVFGIPKTVKSDNGPPFNGQAFADFATRLGFHHRKITPLHPIANGEAERFMRTIEKAIRAAQIDSSTPWQQAIHTFLRNYRATPHSTTGTSPGTVLFQRPMNVKLPLLNVPEDLSHPVVERRDAAAKQRMKCYADIHRHAKARTVNVGDTVLIKRVQRTKLDAIYNPAPYTVVKVHGSMITARRADHMVTRNISMFKVIPKHFVPIPDKASREQDDFRNQVYAPQPNPSASDTPGLPLMRTPPENSPAELPFHTADSAPQLPTTTQDHRAETSRNQVPSTTPLPVPDRAQPAAPSSVSSSHPQVSTTTPNRYPQRERCPPERYGAWASNVWEPPDTCLIFPCPFHNSQIRIR